MFWPRELAILCILLAIAGGASPARAEWATNGIHLSHAAGPQSHPVAVADGAGGAIVAWLDGRSGYNLDIFAQRVLASGTLAPGWLADGVSLTLITCLKYDPAITSDDSGGAFVAWSDDRCSDTTSTNIYVQRVTPPGVIAGGWPRNGVALCLAPHEQKRPAIVPDGTGGALAVWDDHRNVRADLYAARVLAGGELASGWTDGGILIASSTAEPVGPAAVSDGAGGMLVAWEDRRSGASDIRAQHVAAAGTIAPGWGADGNVVCSAPGDQQAPKLVSDGAGGAFVLWTDRRSAVATIYVQRIAGTGAIAPGWPATGVPASPGAGDQGEPVAIADGVGGMLLAWSEARDLARGLDVYAQRLDAAGAPAAGWPAGGLALCTAPGDQSEPALAADAAGGAFAAWRDTRDPVEGVAIYMGRLTGGGALAAGWPTDGFEASVASGDRGELRLVADGTGGAYPVWTDARDSLATGLDIYAHRFAADGPAPTQVRGLAARHHDGQTFLTWTCPPGFGWTYRVYAASAPIASATDIAGATLLGAVGDSTWCDRRLSAITGTVYGYCIDSLATPLGPTQGLFVRTAPADSATYYAVTAQTAGYLEDRTVAQGANALAEALAESAAPPRPVWQRAVSWLSLTPDIYTLWVSDRETPFFPTMANRPGMAFDCGVAKGNAPPNNALMVRCHRRGGSFLEVLGGSGMQGEWVLALDDPLFNSDVASFYYGYGPSYNMTSNDNVPPASGTIEDYSLRRAIYTLLWARRALPVDTTRVYAFGYSMGGIGSALLLSERPDLFAAAMTVVARFDFSFEDDPDTLSAFNSGQPLRAVVDRLWGTMASNLMSSEGLPVYQRLNAGAMAGIIEPQAAPPLIAFNGRYDTTVGWAEKIGFYRAMETHRQGGMFFWDTRIHTATVAAWVPMQNPSYLYRFRTDRSFPALANCSADLDPGDGRATSGDSVGTINGFAEWDTSLVDTQAQWNVALRLRNLTTQWGPWPAPESLTVDVTPRRLQRFHPAGGQPCTWRVVRLADGVVVQSGAVLPDSLGRVTIPSVTVYRSGSCLVLDEQASAGVDPAAAPHLALAPLRNPMVGRTILALSWPRAGEGRVDLLDVSGRLMRCLWKGHAPEGPTRLVLDAAALPSGIYFVCARAGERRVTRRVAALR